MPERKRPPAISLADFQAIEEHLLRCIVGAENAIESSKVRVAICCDEGSTKQLNYWKHVLAGLNWSYRLAKQRLQKLPENA